MYKYIYIYVVFTTDRFLEGSYRMLAWVGFEPTITEFRSDALTHWFTRPLTQLALRANFVQLLQFDFFLQCSHFISVICFLSFHIFFKQNLAQIITLGAEWIDIYGIYQRRIFISSYRKLAWLVFKSLTTEFHSDALTDWAFRPWVQLALRASFLQLLQFYFFVLSYHHNGFLVTHKLKYTIYSHAQVHELPQL